MKNEALLETNISNNHKKFSRIWWNIKEEKVQKICGIEEEEKEKSLHQCHESKLKTNHF